MKKLLFLFCILSVNQVLAQVSIPPAGHASHKLVAFLNGDTSRYVTGAIKPERDPIWNDTVLVGIYVLCNPDQRNYTYYFEKSHWSNVRPELMFMIINRWAVVEWTKFSYRTVAPPSESFGEWKPIPEFLSKFIKGHKHFRDQFANY